MMLPCCLLLLLPFAFLPVEPRSPACTIYVLAFHAIAWPAVFSAHTWKLRAAAYTVLAVGAVRQWAYLGVHSEFLGHVIAGIALIRGGAGVLRTEHGGPMKATLPTGMLGVAIFVVAGVLQIQTTLWRKGMTLRHTAHVFIDLVGALISLGVLLSAAAAAAGCLRAAAAIGRARALLEPAAYLALGVLLYTHRHDGADLAIQMHAVLGVLLMALAAAQLLNNAVHAATGVTPQHQQQQQQQQQHQPQQQQQQQQQQVDWASLPIDGSSASGGGGGGDASELLFLSRALTATAWTLPGVWLVHMSAFLYVYGMGADGSLHQLLWPADQETDAEQAVGLYLALDVLLAAGLVALAQMFGLSAAETEASARVVPATETNGLLQIEEEERN